MKIGARSNRREDFYQQMTYNKTLMSYYEGEQKEKKEKEKENRSPQEWGLHSCMKKIELKSQIVTTPSLRVSENIPNNTFSNWDYSQNKNKIALKAMPSNIYYPPNCSGYDMAYSKTQNAIYIYGGISCSSSLVDGIKPYFFKCFEGRWSQVRPESTYNPTPRYGHTLTAYQKQLILFGGVSEYKEKLKDRCFYTDCSAYSTTKNNWRAVQTSGMNTKTRKNHSACVYNKYYLVYGGLDESEEVINEISWINLDCKKSRWKYFTMQGRFNHKMAVVQPENGKDFICIFGGRNAQSEIVSSMYFLPLTSYDGELAIKEAIEINHTILPREMPVMGEFLEGFVILGGIDKNNQVVSDCWYCDNNKQTFTKIRLNIAFEDLRGAKACSLSGQMLYVMTGNSKNYRALQMLQQK